MTKSRISWKIDAQIIVKMIKSRACRRLRAQLLRFLDVLGDPCFCQIEPWVVKIDPWSLKGRKWKGAVMPFGSCVRHRLSGKPKGGVMSTRWVTGIWLGFRYQNWFHFLESNSVSGLGARMGISYRHQQSPPISARGVPLVFEVPNWVGFRSQH